MLQGCTRTKANHSIFPPLGSVSCREKSRLWTNIRPQNIFNFDIPPISFKNHEKNFVKRCPPLPVTITKKISRKAQLMIMTSRHLERYGQIIRITRRSQQINSKSTSTKSESTKTTTTTTTIPSNICNNNNDVTHLKNFSKRNPRDIKWA